MPDFQSRTGRNLRSRSHRRQNIISGSQITAGAPEGLEITGRSSELYLSSMPLLQLLRRYILNTEPKDHNTGRTQSHRKISTARSPQTGNFGRSPLTAGRNQTPESTAGRNHRKFNDILPPETESHQKIMIAINQTENGTDRQPWKQRQTGNKMPPPETECRHRKITDRPEDRKCSSLLHSDRIPKQHRRIP